MNAPIPLPLQVTRSTGSTSQGGDTGSNPVGTTRKSAGQRPCPVLSDDSALPFVPHLSRGRPRDVGNLRGAVRVAWVGRLGAPSNCSRVHGRDEDIALHERIGTLAKTRLGAVLWAGAGSYSGRPKGPATEPIADRADRCPTADCTGISPVARRRTRRRSDSRTRAGVAVSWTPIGLARSSITRD